MDLRLTVIAPAKTDGAVDVRVSAPVRTPLGAAASRFAAALGERPENWQWECEGAPMDASALLGFPPLLDGAVLSLASQRPDRGHSSGARGTGPPTAMLELHVVSGPDAGAVLALPTGTCRIGRAAEVDLRIADPDVSRVHAVVDVGDEGVLISDAGSANGTHLDGSVVGAEPVMMTVGSRLLIGASVASLRSPDRPPASVRADGAGTLRVNRAPRLRPAAFAAAVSYPAAPMNRRTLRVPWPAAVLPLLISIPLAVFWHQPAFLLIAVASPLLVLGQYGADRRWGRHDAAADSTAHRAAVADADRRTREFLAVDEANRESAAPDLALLLSTACGPTDRIWERRVGDDDFRRVRIGRGAQPSSVTLRRPAEAASAVNDERIETPWHEDVPVSVDVAGVVGVSGPRESVLALVRSMIGQVAVLHSPREVRICVITAAEQDRAEWTWTAWLPHRDPTLPGSRPADADAAPGRRGPISAPSGPPTTIVVIDGASRLRARPDVSQILTSAGSDVHCICLDAAPRDLPLECTTTVALDDAAGSLTATLSRSGHDDLAIRPDLVGRRWAHRLARALAPLRDATPEPGDQLPTAVPLSHVVQRVWSMDPSDPGQVARQWRSVEGGPRLPMGITNDGPYVIDLKRDGPHLLIGGTTGAGKSELLQSLVIGGAVGHPPDRISFLLIDYKGGSAFRSCLNLPHVTGMITDLDPRLSRRALASLVAELRRRERLLRDAGSNDVDEYSQKQRLDTEARFPPLPRLMIVVDEFRVLAEELPDFVSGLVRTAAVGRSLGVHLVLATQRPSGAVSAEMRANVNLRIALRVRDRADALDLVETPAPARLPIGRPGLGIAQIGGEPPRLVQFASVNAVAEEPIGIQVTRLDSVLLEAPTSSPSGDLSTRVVQNPGLAGTSDARAMVAASTAAATLTGAGRPNPPWLPPLPEQMPLGHLLEQVDPNQPNGTGAVSSVIFALADEPELQQQRPIGWDMGGRHLAIAGGPRSGRTTALITLAASAATSGAGAHVYAIDASGDLASLEDMPAVGAVVPATDIERAGRLIRRLAQEISDRRASRTMTPGPPGPALLLLVDGWEALSEAWADVDNGRPLDDLLRIVRDGTAVRLHVAIAGGRAVLTGTPSSLLTERLVLPFADPHEALLVGISHSAMPVARSPGRGLHLSPGRTGAVEVQVALPDEIRTSAPVSPEPWRVPALPARLPRSALVTLKPSGSARAGGHPPESGVLVPIGIGGDDVRLVGLPLGSITGAGRTAVLGPPGSGRSCALATIGAGALESGFHVSVVAAADSPVLGLGRLGAVIVDARSSLSLAGFLDRHDANLSTRSPAIVLIDDPALSVPADGPLEHGLLSTQHHLVIATTTAEVLTAFRGITAAIRGARTGLLLGAVGPGDGEAFGLRIGRAPAGPAGRGLLITAGRTVPVQVAHPDLERAP